MSHRIAYDHLAIRFPLDELGPNELGNSLYRDQYILLELGGDNNVTTYHPRTGREVGSRRWMVIAIGDHIDVMRRVIELSASCEGGDMRLYGERYTKPESYIRKMRGVLDAAVGMPEAASMGFIVTADLVCEPGSEIWGNWEKVLSKLSELIQPEERDGKHCWRLHPVRRNHAAWLFRTLGMQDKYAWGFCQAYGPEFDLNQIKAA